MKQYYIYILSSKSEKLYIWVTSNLIKRIYEHKHKLIDSFTSKYNIDRLVYYELYNDINIAINREKQLKNWHREYKVDLINKFNPSWKDLYLDIIK
jgi:putative endonuclease